LNVFALVMLGFLLVGCDALTYSTAVFYQRLRVTIEVDGELKTGESVMKVKRSVVKSETLIGNRGQTTVKGEAAIVDLGKGFYAFALLAHPRSGRFQAQHIAFKTFNDFLPKRQDFLRSGPERLWLRTKATTKALMELRVSSWPEHTPILVTFGDVDNSETLKVLEPGNMLQAFPKGTFKSVGLVEVELALVDKQPLTKKIDSILEWIRERSPKRHPSSPPLPEVGQNYWFPIDFFVKPTNFRGK